MTPELPGIEHPASRNDLAQRTLKKRTHFAGMRKPIYPDVEALRKSGNLVIPEA
jgi:hypothetical protein